MTKLYNKPIQNMNQEEAKAYSTGQNKGIIAGISMFPIGRGISAVGGILSKAPALSRAIKAFTNAPKQYLNLATKSVNAGDKVKKVNAIKDVAAVPRKVENTLLPDMICTALMLCCLPLWYFSSIALSYC